jgi:Flp pilus assembly secretin CpaC
MRPDLMPVRRTTSRCFKIRMRAALAGVMLAIMGVSGASANGPILVPLDQARVMKLPEKVATVIVGNPLIADVSIQSGGLIVFTGKGFGSTNVMALDAKGDLIFEQQVTVSSPTDRTVVVQRGPMRETFSCAPNCERRATLGDAKEFFDDTISQATARKDKALGR